MVASSYDPIGSLFPLNETDAGIFETWITLTRTCAAEGDEAVKIPVGLCNLRRDELFYTLCAAETSCFRNTNNFGFDILNSHVLQYAGWCNPPV